MNETNIGPNGQIRVGVDLARLRLSTGAKQSKIGDAVKVDTSRISRIETGEITPDADEVAKIARAIGTKDAKDQVKWALSNIKGAESIPILFFDVLNDEHQAI